MLYISEIAGKRRVILDNQDITDKCIRCTCYMYRRNGLPLTELLIEDDINIKTEKNIDIKINKNNKSQKKFWDNSGIGWVAILFSLLSLIISVWN